MNLSIHLNTGSGKPSGITQFGFLVEDNDEIIENFDSKDYKLPNKRQGGDGHFAECRALDPDGNNFDISTNSYQDIRPDQK